jgi:hypothetical protein
MRARNKKGAHIGSYFMWVYRPDSDKYKRVTLATKDFEKAKARRVEAMNGRRDFTFDDDEQSMDTPRAPEPAPVIPIIPSSHQLTAPEYQPIVLPPEPAPVDQRPAEPAPSTGIESPPDDWTKDAARAAGAPEPAMPTASATEPENKDAPAPAAHVDDGQIRIKDLEQLGPVFVTASRIVVQLQIALHVLVARYLFKTELDPIRDEMPKDVVGFMKAQGEKWADTDPREPGRAMWERFGRRICPDNLVLPDWALAPALVAVGTLPIQVANRKPVVAKAKPHVPIIAPQPSVPAQADTPRPPAPEPMDPTRTRHIPVMMTTDDVS